jgi:Ca-activated chloride channel family protein
MLSDFWDYLDPGFLAPVWLLVGFAATAVLVLLEIRAWFRRKRAVQAFAASHLLVALAGSVSQAKRVFKALLLIAATGLLCLALARPHLLFDWTDETRSGLDILLAVDCSKSMLTEDVRPNRLERAKLAIADFAEHLPDNRLGLIAFAGDAFLQCPLTLDHEAFLDSVRDLDTDTIPKPGTDIATAIDEAVDALRSQPNNMKFLILITDGEDLEGRVLAAAKNAAQNGLKIYTVGVGTANGDRIPERDEMGVASYHHDLSGQEVVSKLDENTLKQIAEITGGAYAPLGQAGDGLDQIYDRYIAPLPKQNLEEKRQKIPIERFEWPLALAILFLMGEFMINERTRTPEAPVVDSARKPVRRRHTRKDVATGAVAVLALFLLSAVLPVSAADTATPEREYKAGDFENAMQGYQKAAEGEPSRNELQFNRGDAAYKAGEFSEAEEAYRNALDTPDLHLQEQTYYNLGNTQYQHGAALLKVSSRKTVKLWEAALHSYECALKLKDSTDTRHNYEVVKEKLEQLKQQRKQRGNKGSSSSGQGQSGDGSQQQKGNNPQSGQMDSDDDDDDGDDSKDQGNQSGQEKNTDSAKGGKDAQQQQAGATQNLPVRAYSKTRSQDLKDPGIKSRQDAENLLDSLKDDEHHVTARSLTGNGQDAPPPSGKDW